MPWSVLPVNNTFTSFAKQQSSVPVVKKPNEVTRTIGRPNMLLISARNSIVAASDKRYDVPTQIAFVVLK